MSQSQIIFGFHPIISQLRQSSRSIQEIYLDSDRNDPRVKEIIELAKNVELGDAIDWSEVNVDRDAIYQMIGSQTYEIYAAQCEEEDGEAVLLATVVKLVVENFVLNLQIPGNNIP